MVNVFAAIFLLKLVTVVPQQISFIVRGDLQPLSNASRNGPQVASETHSYGFFAQIE